MTKVYITESGYKLNVASTLRMTASEAETLLDGVFEPVLGNPGTNGYVLSSTTAGVRSWVAQSGGGGASDVGDLTTTSGSSTNMLRVAAAGGLEYRTTAQVLSDIGAAPTASPTFTGTVTAPTIVGGVIKPSSDSATALQLTNAAGTAVVTVDTTTPRAIFSNDVRVLGPWLTFYNTAGNARYFSLYADGSNNILGSDAGNFQISHRGATGELQFKTNNTTRMTIDAAGAAISALIKISAAASTTAAASLRIPSGTAPTSPNAGDIWFDGTNLKMYDGTTTRTISWT